MSTEKPSIEGAQGIQERRKLSWNGIIFASVSLDERGDIVDGPVVVVKGFSEPDGRLADESLESLEEAADIAVSGLKRKNRFDDDAVERPPPRGRASTATCSMRAFVLRTPYVTAGCKRRSTRQPTCCAGCVRGLRILSTSSALVTALPRAAGSRLRVRELRRSLRPGLPARPRTCSCAPLRTPCPPT